MSITKINLSIKQAVLIRLLTKGEDFTDACSKSGLYTKDAVKFLVINNSLR
jgi:hypothetical protein